MNQHQVISPSHEAAAAVDEVLRGDFGLVGPIPLHAPKFDAADKELVNACLDEGWVSTAGHFVDEFEALIARACDVKHAIATTNGTSALHAALHCIGVTKDDAVLCPALTFIATANAISYTGAAPIFLDSSISDLGIDLKKLSHFLETECSHQNAQARHKKSGRAIKAIVPVHVFGHACDLHALTDICRNWNIAIIEDAAEALGSSFDGRPCGGFGTAATLSFNGNKPVTTGGGGAIVTNDESLAKRLKHVTTTAKLPHAWRYDHDEIGFNYRLPSLNAALGIAQMRKLGAIIESKRKIAKAYENRLSQLADVLWVSEPARCRSNYWLNAIILPNAEQRDMFLELTNSRDIQTRPCWTLIPNTAAYRDAIQAPDLTHARMLESRLVNLPSSPWMLPSQTGQ